MEKEEQNLRLSVALIDLINAVNKLNVAGRPLRSTDIHLGRAMNDGEELLRSLQKT